jgi:hypothetical protein
LADSPANATTAITPQATATITLDLIAPLPVIPPIDQPHR